MGLKSLMATLAFAALLPGPAGAQDGAQTKDQQDATLQEIERYREMIADGNPAELYELRGEELWKAARGPRRATLQMCDLGLGPGVVKGAYAKLPRYFADTDRVQDLESRLVSCMVTLQGLNEADIIRKPFGQDSYKPEIEAIVAFVVGQSKGVVISPPLNHAREKEALDMGRRMFAYRAGPYDFSCATCHSENGRRIRLQDLPNLTTHIGAARAYGSWPAYRVSQGEFRSMQWRMNDCFRQQRFPEPVYGSDVVTALISYLAHTAAGGVYDGPGIKR